MKMKPMLVWDVTADPPEVNRFALRLRQCRLNPSEGKGVFPAPPPDAVWPEDERITISPFDRSR